MSWEGPAVTLSLAILIISFTVFKINRFEWDFHPSSAAHSHFLSQFLLDGGSINVPPHLYSIHAQSYGNNRVVHEVPQVMANSISPMSNTQQDGDHPFEDRGPAAAEHAVRHVDSSSLSEDDVFYN